jgi:hypothetical protein
LINPEIGNNLFLFLNIFKDEIMAQHSTTNTNPDTLSRSQSNLSIKSYATVDSTRSSAASSSFSTTSSQKRRGVLGKIGTGFQSLFRRLSRSRITLTEMEIQILSATTDFTREEVLQW